MNSRQLSRISFYGLALTLLAACGGDDDGPASASAGLSSPERLGAFVDRYNAGLGALATATGLADPGFTDLYDERYLDAGQNKQQVRDALAQEAAAQANGSGLPVAVFPAATLADAAVSDCDEASATCTLTATVVNSDADVTRAPFTTRLRFSDGKFRLYGDQQVASI
jgi:hypothetical protein